MGIRKYSIDNIADSLSKIKHDTNLIFVFYELETDIMNSFSDCLSEYVKITETTVLKNRKTSFLLLYCNILNSKIEQLAKKLNILDCGDFEILVNASNVRIENEKQLHASSRLGKRIYVSKYEGVIYER